MIIVNAGKLSVPLKYNIMKDKITLVILRHSGAKIDQATFSKNFLLGTVFCLAIFLLSFTMVVVNYFNLKKTVVNKDLLEYKVSHQLEEISNQREQIQVFADEINSLKSGLLKLNEFEKKIRIIANIEQSKNSESIFGIGGSTPVDLEANISLENKHSSLIREMHEQVGSLELASTTQKQSFETILKKLEDKRNLLASTPSVFPAKGWISSSFGYRKSPFTGRREMHKGLDIAARKGEPIIATANGVVSFSGKKGLLGKTVVIDHGHGVSTRYGHCYKILKKRGDAVKRGDVIARIGNTGRSTGPHLHYEVRLNGVQVNPIKYIINRYAEKESGKSPKT